MFFYLNNFITHINPFSVIFLFSFQFRRFPSLPEPPYRPTAFIHSPNHMTHRGKALNPSKIHLPQYFFHHLHYFCHNSQIRIDCVQVGNDLDSIR